jgi:hypothetical protein
MVNRERRGLLLGYLLDFSAPAHKGEIRNGILCGFLPLFFGIGCWSASIPSDHYVNAYERP